MGTMLSRTNGGDHRLDTEGWTDKEIERNQLMDEVESDEASTIKAFDQSRPQCKDVAATSPSFFTPSEAIADLYPCIPGHENSTKPVQPASVGDLNQLRPTEKPVEGSPFYFSALDYVPKHDGGTKLELPQSKTSGHVKGNETSSIDSWSSRDNDRTAAPSILPEASVSSDHVLLPAIAVEPTFGSCRRTSLVENLAGIFKKKPLFVPELKVIPNVTFSKIQLDINSLDQSVLSFVSELTSTVASQKQLAKLWQFIPPRYSVSKPYIIFTTNEHGCSLRNFLHMVEEVEPVIILVKTSRHEVLGAYCSTKWAERKAHKVFGTGETFLFSFSKTDSIKVNRWVGFGASSDTALTVGQQLFQSAIEDRGLDVGNGGLFINCDMDRGRSCKTTTFANEPLAQDEEFGIQVVEAITFE